MRPGREGDNNSPPTEAEVKNGVTPPLSQVFQAQWLIN
jgi:hypothetical protein